jgi:DNA-directed RNA polymerase specialized sigma24 family protein
MSRQPFDLRSAFVEHQPRLQRAAQRILGDPAQAQDVVQDAYLKAVESASGEIRFFAEAEGLACCTFALRRD